MKRLTNPFRPRLRWSGERSATQGWVLLTIFAVLFLGAMSALLWRTHAASAQHDSLALEQFRWDTANLAANLEYFFQERRSDMQNLAGSRPVESYFENVALGMSPRYGLLASIQEIEISFRKYLGEKMLAQKTIFECITLRDETGTIVVRLEQGGMAAAANHNTPTLSAMEADNEGLLWKIVDEGSGNVGLVITQPVIFHGKREGSVSARMSLETLFSALVRDQVGGKQREYCLAFDGKSLACPGAEFESLASAMQGLVGSVSQISSSQVPGAKDGIGAGPLLGTAARVGGTPFMVLSMIPEKALVGSATWPLLVLIGALSLVLLAGLALFGRTNAQRMVLNARVEEQKSSESALRKRMEEFSTLFNALPGYAFYKDPAGVYVTANSSFCAAVGFPLEAIVGKRDDELFPEHLAQGYMRDDQLLLSGDKDFYEIEETILDHGREVRLITRKLALRHSDGCLGGLIGLGFDITEKKHIEEELRQANDRMEEGIRLRTEELALANALLQEEIAERLKAHQAIKLILDSISAILIVLDADGQVTHWGNAAHLSFGMSLGEVVGRRFAQLPLAWDWNEVANGLATCRETGQTVKLSNVWYERPDGSDGFLVVSVTRLCAKGSDMSGYLLLGEDITEVRALEAQLSQAAKLEAIGQLAAGIAHEINTPTQYVGDSVTFLKDAYEDLNRLVTQANELSRLPSPCGQSIAASLSSLLEEIDAPFLGEEIPKTIERIYEGIERISTIVLAMKRFSYNSGNEKKAMDIRNAIENTLVISRNEWKYVAEATTDFDSELSTVMCLAGDMNQVLLNIIVNAAHAISDVVRESNGLGRIAISTRKDNEFAEIRIQDTGTGIPKEVGDKVFNLFFTTKEVGKGTGQGLAIAYDIVVNKHNGSITFESEPGQGTTFIIRLPLAG